jgi:succinate-semialdehyde dehydrogenase/glutarate-semialdehyde dehydrogenase
VFQVKLIKVIIKNFSMAIQSINPATGKLIKEYKELSDQEVIEKIDKSNMAYKTWKNTTFDERKKIMLEMARLYKENARELGELATLEMGKPIKQAIAEAEKCATALEYYANNAEKQLAEEIIETESSKSYVRFDPLGIILAVMPWNFPYWQAIRAIAPNLMAGNTMLLKHASNVGGCALKIEEVALKAGVPEGVFQTLLIGSSKVEMIINDDRVKGVTLTGSEYAGMKVGEAAGRNIKPVVLELGGSDPFIILEDANLEEVMAQAITARLQNNGQSCICAKRFIVHENLYEEFLKRFKEGFESQAIGNPMDESTTIGPVVNKESVEDLLKLVIDSVKMGATLVTGGKTVGDNGFFLQPTIVTNITKEMPLYAQEAFGPVASVYKFKDISEALELANDTTFGLGASIWTKDIKEAEDIAKEIDSGFVAINQIVRSNTMLPFGGVKKSGVGRELSEFGIREFVNVKTVVVK